uniref:Coiled-coil domain-containing protein 25 n=1 Tax=Steinernema glaseri TaxID=37863 RepID=A0A1I7Z565_9BILA
MLGHPATKTGIRSFSITRVEREKQTKTSRRPIDGAVRRRVITSANSARLTQLSTGLWRRACRMTRFFITPRDGGEPSSGQKRPARGDSPRWPGGNRIFFRNPIRQESKMVLKYYSNAVNPPAMIYMGRDKVENENLIRWGWPEDVWFHVDNLSSAHVYLRLEAGQTIEDVPKELIEDCAQLVKANSIKGCKMSDVVVCYTPWENLRKTGDMDVGQIGFHRDKDVKKIRVEKKNDVVNRLKKTEVKDHVIDYQAEREARDAKLRSIDKARKREQLAQQEAERKRLEQEREQMSYDRLMDDSKMTSNADGNDSDDFM